MKTPPAETHPYVPMQVGRAQERRDEMQHEAIPAWVVEALQRHGVAVRRSPRWIEEAHSGQLARYQSARSALIVK